MLGTQLPRGGSIGEENGRLIARGALDKALTTQLASADPAGAGGQGVHILLSFKAADGRYCRGYQDAASAGIACHNGTVWQIERTQASDLQNGSSRDYRQAGSAAGAIMESAQNMALDGALDEKSERMARDSGWKR